MTGVASLQPRQIAIVDPCCAAGYAPQALAAGGLGGTEATVLRVAAALSANTPMHIFQKGRTDTKPSAAGRLRPLSEAFARATESTIIVINAWKVACKLRKVHPAARILLWLHGYPGRHNRPMGSALRAADIAVVCVSRTHADWLRDFLGDTAPDITHIHNPIADHLTPDNTRRDPDRLLFASSPHKGLAQVFKQFAAAREAIPTLTLAVADPGYLAWDTGSVPDGVTFLGALPHPDLIAGMRRALCLFYPQTSFAETFGLVMAEANAVGTPVLVHRDLGANAEVVGDPAQCIDGNDLTQVVDRLRHWRVTPPVVRVNPQFRLSTVASQWADLLDRSETRSHTLDRVA